MNNKTDIEEDINRCKKIIEDNTRTIQVIEKTLTSRTEKEELEKDNRAIENILADRERLKEENKNLNYIVNAGLSKEKQYCFNEDGNTGKCLGYESFFDDEPCDYCKSCERINIKEDN